MQTEVLFEEYREGVLECLHYGTACVVDRNGVVASVGDSDWTCFFRSASKPIQALPVLVRGLHRKYGLSEEEKERFTAAHPGVQISFNAKHQTSDGWREHERYTHYCWCLKHQTWIPFGEPLPEK